MITLFQLKHLGVPKYTIIHDKIKEIIEECGNSYENLQLYPLLDIGHLCLRRMTVDQKQYLTDCSALCTYENICKDGCLTLPSEELPETLIYGKERIKLVRVQRLKLYTSEGVITPYSGIYEGKRVLINPKNIDPYEYNSKYSGKGNPKPRFRELTV